MVDDQGNPRISNSKVFLEVAMSDNIVRGRFLVVEVNMGEEDRQAVLSQLRERPGRFELLIPLEGEAGWLIIAKLKYPSQRIEHRIKGELSILRPPDDVVDQYLRVRFCDSLGG